jgi:chromosome segregation ATPase
MRIRRDETLDALGGDLDLLLRRLPMTAAVLAGESFDLLAGPESGHHESLAGAEEALEEAKARLSTLEKKLAEVSVAVDAAGTTGDSESADHVEELERNREIVLRRTIKARVRVESTQADVDALLGS